MSRICIIPARAGSKRIKQKNIKNFLGKPIIGYSIKAALDSKEFEKVMVSTDSEEIAAIARKYGAEVPFYRSNKNSDDHAVISDVINEVLSYYKERGTLFEQVACLFATAPFISANKIKQVNSMLLGDEYDSVFTIQKYSSSIFRSFKMNDNKLEMFWPENISVRSQDLPDAYYDAGQYYCAKTECFISNGSFFTGSSGGFILSDIEARDIDTKEDWVFAEKIFTMLNNDLTFR